MSPLLLLFLIPVAILLSLWIEGRHLERQIAVLEAAQMHLLQRRLYRGCWEFDGERSEGCLNGEPCRIHAPLNPDVVAAHDDRISRMMADPQTYFAEARARHRADILRERSEQGKR